MRKFIYKVVLLDQLANFILYCDKHETVITLHIFGHVYFYFFTLPPPPPSREVGLVQGSQALYEPPGHILPAQLFTTVRGTEGGIQKMAELQRDLGNTFSGVEKTYIAIGICWKHVGPG